jgi:hypothetical protein
MHDAYLRQRPALGAASGPHVDVGCRGDTDVHVERISR